MENKTGKIRNKKIKSSKHFWKIGKNNMLKQLNKCLPYCSKPFDSRQSIKIEKKRLYFLLFFS